LPTYTYKAYNRPLCMVINNRTKGVFYPGVDMFTLLQISDCTARCN